MNHKACFFRWAKERDGKENVDLLSSCFASNSRQNAKKNEHQNKSTELTEDKRHLKLSQGCVRVQLVALNNSIQKNKEGTETGHRKSMPNISKYFKSGSAFCHSIMRLTLFWVTTPELIIKAMVLNT